MPDAPLRWSIVYANVRVDCLADGHEHIFATGTATLTIEHGRMLWCYHLPLHATRFAEDLAMNVWQAEVHVRQYLEQLVTSLPPATVPDCVQPLCSPDGMIVGHVCMSLLTTHPTCRPAVPLATLTGHLCEVCLDAPATCLRPASWGGEMGVCGACADTHAAPEA